MPTRIILFTGKGGVGKTTCAAASALQAAEEGAKTLIMSSDPAHSLSDALSEELSPEPEEVAPNLYAQEVDLYYSMRKYWGNIRELMLSAFKWQGVEKIAAEEMAALPGMAEASALLWLERFEAEDAYDCIVVDSAPTGETLSLLTLPQATHWWVTRAFPFQKAAIKTFGFGLRKTTGIPLDKGYEEFDRLFGKLNRIQKVLADPEVSSVRLVTNPERMVIQEARRAYTYLQLYGYNIDAVIINRIFPEEGAGEALARYVEAQKGYIEEIERSFSPLPLFRVPHLGEEVFGQELLRQIGAGLYEGRKVTKVFHQEQTYQLREENEDYVLEVKLPFVEQDKLRVSHHGDQLVLDVHNQRHNYHLPSFLSYYTLSTTTVDQDRLRARFTPTRDAT